MGWSYFAFFPKKAEIASSVPSHWTSCLAHDQSDGRQGFFLRIKTLLANVLPFRKVFQSIERNEQAIVFLEHFELAHLVSITIALFFLKPRFRFWILHRYDLENRRTKSFLLRLFHLMLCRKLKNRVRCLTDSDLLARALEKRLFHPFTVVPIPHTEQARKTQTSSIDAPLLFWWPGGLIREDKGLITIQKLVSSMKERSDIRLVMAEKAKGAVSQESSVCFVPTVLSREEYVEWMQRANLILLPYFREDYRYRTSGIFVEAISMGAIPVVTQGTWMAYELGKFGLSELIFDWDETDLINRLCTLCSDQKVAGKLQVMRSHYHEFHSEQGFATALAKIAADI